MRKNAGCEIVKCGKMLFEGAGEDFVGLSMCDSPMNTVFIKKWVRLDM